MCDRDRPERGTDSYFAVKSAVGDPREVVALSMPRVDQRPIDERARGWTASSAAARTATLTMLDRPMGHQQIQERKEPECCAEACARWRYDVGR